jgi:methionyl-tRNA synthetase
VSFYVTTPIYYVNAAPHLGHAYTSIAADVLARHHRQRGEKVFFLTGTDEHGEPVAVAAEEQGVTPLELADRNSQRFRDLMPQLDATNDFFIRTTDPEHIRRVQEILVRVRENGYVYEGTYEGWYCPRCADFKTDAEIGPGNTCPIHEIPLIRERENNYFFQLSAFQERLETLFDDNPDFVKPRHRFNEARSFLAGGLQDVSLTRPKLRWGVEVPWDRSQVFYVWFDALLNYVTALGFARGKQQDLTKEFWPASYHLIGKDILKFHTIYWPALLMAAGLDVPQHVFVHGFLLTPSTELDEDGNPVEKKMSKSRGNVIDPFQVIEDFGSDALRFYLLREVNFGHDGPVSVEGFHTRYETELANDYGNLASRTIAMIVRYRDGQLGATELDPELVAEFADLPDVVAQHLDGAELSPALEEIWKRIRRLNRYVEEQAPWKLAKDEERAGDLDRVLASLHEGIRVITVLLTPYLPAATEKLLSALGRPDTAWEGVRCSPAPISVQPLEPLFPKR